MSDEDEIVGQLRWVDTYGDDAAIEITRYHGTTILCNLFGTHVDVSFPTALEEELVRLLQGEDDG